MKTCTVGYDSHLDVLREVLPPNARALEFGAGEQSTAFLIREAAHLTSVETDPEWHAWAKKRYRRADNWTLLAKRPRGVGGFDFILVDDGADAAARVRTLCWLLDQPKLPIVAIHDANVPEYRAVLDGLGLAYELHDEQSPWTAVLRP